jgi:hypothetical protein
MVKDNRYKAIKAMLEANNFKTFKEVFDIIPKSIVATDLGIHYDRFVKRINNPENFSLEELIIFSHLIGTNPSILINLAMKDIESNKKRFKK